MEACKRAGWRKHLEPSMRLLASCIDRVEVARAHSDCLKIEREQGAAMDLTGIIDPQATKVVRAMLGAFASGETQDWLDRMAPFVEKAKSTVLPQYFAHEGNLDATRVVHSSVLSVCRPELQKALRRKQDKRLVHRIATYITSGLLLQLAPKFDYAPARLDAEYENPSYMARSVWLRVFYILDWIALGGIDHLTGEKNSNDEIDRHYVIVASYVDGFITGDRKAERAERALRSALSEWELFSDREAHWFQ